MRLENSALSTSMAVSFSVTSSLIITTNLAVILHVSRHRRLQQGTNIFILSLATADLIVGLIVLPVNIHLYMSTAVLGRAHCVLLPYFQLVSVCASAFTMIAIAYDRYRAIVTPTSTPLNDKSALKAVIGVWLLAFLYSCRTFTSLTDTHNPTPAPSDNTMATSGPMATVMAYDVTEMGMLASTLETGVSNVDAAPVLCDLFAEDATSDLYVRVADLCVVFLAPLVALMVLHAAIIKRLWRVPTFNQSQTVLLKKRRLAKMFMIIMALFFLCWGPWHAYDIINDTMELYEEDVATEEESTEISALAVRITLTLAALSNSWMTPVIYVIFNNQFRADVTHMLRCRWGAIWRASSKVGPTTTTVAEFEKSKDGNRITVSELDTKGLPQLSSQKVGT